MTATHSTPEVLNSEGLQPLRADTQADLGTKAVSATSAGSDGDIFRSVAEEEFGEVDTDEVPEIRLSLLMCAYNERKTISRAVREVLAVEFPCEVELVIVDDGSTDGTASLVQRIKDPRIVLHVHEHNQGKGAALRTAVSLAKGTHMLPFDADLEYAPKDIPRLIEPIMTGRFEVVYGTRLFGYNTVYQSFKYAMGNRVLTMMTNILYNAYLSDLHTCLKLIPLDTFRSLELSERGFGLDTELTAALLRLGIRPFEVPVSYYSRSHAEGKKINWRDALQCVQILFRVRTRRKKRLTHTVATQEPQLATAELRAVPPPPAAASDKPDAVVAG